ncbi:MAG TPA: SGNH/GDSL hydrolase family protein [Thermoanaerobaculia bacterium]|nr:SGNH/GDSL hydrolase family protein [Thermoanaerobaculia bacterium]
MTDAPSHSPSSRQRLLAAGIGIFLALAAGEILLRIVGAPEVAPVRRGRFQLSADPRLVFEPVPGLVHQDTASHSFFEYTGASNRLGYRDRDHTLAKPPGTYRIVVLGDSIAEGYRIQRTQDAFPALLEQDLRKARLPVEVLNFGVTGYNTQQEVETLRRRALAFSPDLVLVAYCHNDRRPPDPRIVQALREAAEGRRVLPLAETERLLVHSALYRFVRYAVLEARREEAESSSAGDTVEPSLRELAKLSRREGFEVLLAVFPYLPKLYDGEHARQHARLERLARELGFHHLDLRPAFRDCRAGGADKLRFDRYHPTAAGHRCAADAMAAAVEGIIRRRPSAPRAGS